MLRAEHPESMVGHFGTGLSRGPEQVDVEVVTASENRPALSNPDKGKQPQLNFGSNRLGIFYTFDPKKYGCHGHPG